MEGFLRRFLKNLFVFLILYVFQNIAVSQTFTTTGNGTGNWIDPNDWHVQGTGNNLPTYPPLNGSVGGMSNHATIIINHDITLYGSLVGNNSRIEMKVGEENPANLIITEDNIMSRTGSLTIFENSSVQIGIAPVDYPDFDFCDTFYDGDYRRSLFSVDASEGSPKLLIKENSSFIVYGDFVVANNYTIDVMPGAIFDIRGHFDASNSSDLSFTGSGGTIGCDMHFGNSADILITDGTLEVGGDLWFGNSGDIYMDNSTLVVGGSICSEHGAAGSDAFIFIHGSSDSENTSTVSAGDICTDKIQFSDIIVTPIELYSFDSKVNPEHIELNWVTASELNNDFFTLERSSDLYAWEIVGHLQGAGTTSEKRHYSLNDYNPLDGVTYYRLKQTDFDGKFEYFGPLSVMYLPGAEGLDFRVVRHPDQWTIHVPAEGIYHVELYSLSGQRIYSGKVSQNLSIPAPSQTVVVRVFNDYNHSSSRVVMQ